MAWIALDLDRSTFNGADQDAAAISSEQQSRRETQRHARRLALRHLHVGHDLLIRSAAGCERQRRPADK